MTLNYEDIDQNVCGRCGVRDSKRKHASIRNCVEALLEIATRIARTKGTAAPHASAAPTQECIDALRDEIALAEFKQTQHRKAPCRRRVHAPVIRRDTKIIILDGDRVNLTEAARRLHISPVALHFRLIARTGSKEYAGTDVRAVHADIKWTPIEASRAAHAGKARLHDHAMFTPPGTECMEAAR